MRKKIVCNRVEEKKRKVMQTKEGRKGNKKGKKAMEKDMNE